MCIFEQQYHFKECLGQLYVEVQPLLKLRAYSFFQFQHLIFFFFPVSTYVNVMLELSREIKSWLILEEFNKVSCIFLSVDFVCPWYIQSDTHSKQTYDVDIVPSPTKQICLHSKHTLVSFAPGSWDFAYSLC